MTRVRLASGGWLGPRTWRAFRSPGSAPLVPLPWFRAPGSAPVVLRFLVVQDGGGSAGKIRLTSHFSNISHSASCRTIVARAPGGIGKRAPRESEPRVRREKSEPRVRREESEPRVRREDRRTAEISPTTKQKRGPVAQTGPPETSLRLRNRHDEVDFDQNVCEFRADGGARRVGLGEELPVCGVELGEVGEGREVNG